MRTSLSRRSTCPHGRRCTVLRCPKECSSQLALLFGAHLLDGLATQSGTRQQDSPGFREAKTPKCRHCCDAGGLPTALLRDHAVSSRCDYDVSTAMLIPAHTGQVSGPNSAIRVARSTPSVRRSACPTRPKRASQSCLARTMPADWHRPAGISGRADGWSPHCFLPCGLANPCAGSGLRPTCEGLMGALALRRRQPLGLCLDLCQQLLDDLVRQALLQNDAPSLLQRFRQGKHELMLYEDQEGRTARLETRLQFGQKLVREAFVDKLAGQASHPGPGQRSDDHAHRSAKQPH